MFSLRHHFDLMTSANRGGEWKTSCQSVVWGVILLLPGDTFQISTAFRIMAAIFSETTFGWIMLAIGVARIVGLIVNGSKGRVTSGVRVLSAFVGFGSWTFITLCFAASGLVSVWIAAWPFIAITELFNLRRSITDAKVLYDGRPG